MGKTIRLKNESGQGLPENFAKKEPLQKKQLVFLNEKGE